MLGRGPSVTRLVHWQATFTWAAMVSIAVPQGVAGGRAIYRRFLDPVGSRIELVIPAALIAGAVAVLLVLVNFAGALPAHRCRHVLPARVLTDE